MSMTDKPVLGRPPFEITPEICEEAKTLASQGLTLEQTAHSLGISYQTLNERKKEFPDFADAIAVGKAQGIEKVTNALFNKAKEGDVPAIKYYLNNRDNDNWKDKVYGETDHYHHLTEESDTSLDAIIAENS